MAQHLGTESISTWLWTKKLHELEGEELRREAKNRLGVCVWKLENDCSDLVKNLRDLGEK